MALTERIHGSLHAEPGVVHRIDAPPWRD
jgi:hypothetical protein